MMCDKKHEKLYDTFIDLYKFYWGIAIKLFIFNLGLTGAISAYVIKNQSEPLLIYSLAVPIIFTFFVSWLGYISKPGMELSEQKAIEASEKMGLSAHPEFKSLIRFMSVTKIICFLIGIGLIVIAGILFCKS
jgi:hypothetical protein